MSTTSSSLDRIEFTQGLGHLSFEFLLEMRFVVLHAFLKLLDPFIQSHDGAFSILDRQLQPGTHRGLESSR